MRDLYGVYLGVISSMAILLGLDLLGIRLPSGWKLGVLGNRLHIMNCILRRLIGLSLRSLAVNCMRAQVMARSPYCST